MHSLRQLATIVASSIGGVALLLGLSCLSHGPRPTAALTTIEGIPFSVQEGSITILEPLAHTDIFLREPVLFKKLVITFEFRPHMERKLAMGVRENDFWLSYQPFIFYQTGAHAAAADWQQASIEIPLTDKLQDKDRSIDIIFFAGQDSPQQLLAQRTQVHTLWELRNMQTTVAYDIPSEQQLRDFVKAVWYRERPL